MIIPITTTRNNGISYLLWSWVLRNNGAFCAWLDGVYLGSSRGMNDYDALALSYKSSNVKPDKQYSILPTVMQMAGDLSGKIVVDLGCGSGFFTQAFANAGAITVCGVDNAPQQIALAEEVAAHPAINYRVGDIFTQIGGPVDVVNAPFVANYARTVPILKHFFSLVFDSLTTDGKAIFVIDLPNGKCLKRFGAMKTLCGPLRDETKIEIELFNEERSICTLSGVYFTPETVERLLREVGFKRIQWHQPIVSSEGIDQYGADFWDGYTEDSELGYVVAYT